MSVDFRGPSLSYKSLLVIKTSHDWPDLRTERSSGRVFGATRKAHNVFSFQKEHFQLSLAYLADIFEALNSLNLKLQGRTQIEDLKRKIKGHLKSLQDEIFLNFTGAELSNLIYKLVSDPFLVNIEDLPQDLQEEAIELQFNNRAKGSFEGVRFENFSVKLQAKYPKISSQSLCILVTFSSTYLCETGLSALMTLNTQHRIKSNVECDL
ncbi:Protein ZBED8 [Trichinella pseudospiralis]|uniref:Protein ZBED8 n=1 Tax=Trichinella pseudospiralis TaxID=6337 RepID=A0A0V1EK43_TRIPS|nr:Protein ZBED8 [Trichinella pseudospiralis]KRZ10831.1 Protein ZBED8 [Trichinella pseudospiralis]